jgi:hypothetical protein
VAVTKKDPEEVTIALTADEPVMMPVPNILTSVPIPSGFIILNFFVPAKVDAGIMLNPYDGTTTAVLDKVVTLFLRPGIHIGLRSLSNPNVFHLPNN